MKMQKKDEKDLVYVGKNIFVTSTELVRSFRTVSQRVDENSTIEVIITNNGKPRYVLTDVEQYNENEKLKEKYAALLEKAHDLEIENEALRRIETPDRKFMSKDELGNYFTEDLMNAENPYLNLVAEDLFDE